MNTILGVHLVAICFPSSLSDRIHLSCDRDGSAKDAIPLYFAKKVSNLPVRKYTLCS